MLEDNNAIVMVNNSNDIATTVAQWLQSPETRNDCGKRAKQVADNNRGALDKLCALIEGSHHVI